MRLLSGGNQQKVVLARWLEAGSKVLVMDEPTRGVDVGAKVDIYRILEELVEQGAGIVMSSTDLPRTPRWPTGSSSCMTARRSRWPSATRSTKPRSSTWHRESARERTPHHLVALVAGATRRTAPGPSDAPSGESWSERLRPRGVPASQGVGLIALLLIMIVYFSWASPFFLSLNNFLNVGANIAYVGIMAIAMTMVIVSGGFDLSVGAVVALTAVTIAKLVGEGVDIWVSVIVGFVLGPIVGLVNGLLITKVGINPLITTLGSMSIVRGMAFVLTGGLTGTIADPGFAYIGRGEFFEVPVPLLILVGWFVVALVVMTSTRFGRDLYAIGGNAEASRLAGIPVDRRKIAVYVISGGAASVAGIVLASQLGAGAPQSAAGVELTVITAVILGGTSLSGGKGTVWGTMLGVFIMGVLNNGLALLRVSSFYQEVFRGAVLLLAVAVDQLGQRRRR